MKVFISSATADLKTYQNSKIVDFLENQENIEKVWYWDRDSKNFSSIINYVEYGITNCDFLLAISTHASLNSGRVNQEIDLAIYSNNPIIPVFTKIQDVRPLLRPKVGILFDYEHLNGFLQKLYIFLVKDSQYL